MAALLAGWATLFAATPAAAKSISITIGQRTEAHGDTLVANTTVRNSGDDTARGVVVMLRFGDNLVRGIQHELLAPGASFEEELVLATDPLTDGRWPYTIAVDYGDANLYPFEALLMATAVVGNPPPPKISVAEVKTEPIATSGTVVVRFKNLAATAREAAYRIVVPEGLEVDAPSGRIKLEGWGETSTEFALVNRTALPGSRYPVFIAVDYDDGGIHQGLVSQGTVAIIEPHNFWERNQTLMLVAALVLVAAWLAFVVGRATGRKN